MIKKIIPNPLMTFALLVLWLLLQQSISVGQILLGTAVSLIAIQGIIALKPDPVKIYFSKAMLELCKVVLIDILRSNWAVITTILKPQQRRPKPAFVTIQLEVNNRYALAVLSIILAATPGTLWLQYDPAQGTLLIHTLDEVVEGYWESAIKNRYEHLLMEIFE